MNHIKLEKDNEKIYAYDILRIIATLLVIVSHCGYYNIITKYGGIDYGEKLKFMHGDTIIHILFSYLVNFIYTFHMPLFIGLSGSLFYIQLKNIRFKSMNELIANKAKRLLIPFFVVTFIYSIPIKFISGYFKDCNNSLKDIIVGQVLIQGNTHLWFLPTLFLCFIFIYIMEKYVDISPSYKTFLLIFLHLMSYIIPIMIIRYVFQYLIWFYLGFLFESIREKINNILKCNENLWLILLTSMIILYILIKSNLFGDYFFIKILYKFIMIVIGIIGCLLMYMLSFKISNLDISKTLIFKKLLKTSLGLYLYSDPINYLILFVIYRRYNLSMFSSEIGSFIIIIIRFIVTFFISFSITKILQKLKVKYIV